MYWDDRSLNKCHTAARKYFLLALFQIPTGEEADADQGDNDRALNDSGIADRAIEARRAAVQLNRSFSKPNYVIEPPKRRLDRERHVGAGWEAKIKAEQRDRRTGKFQQPIPQRYDERNPPPDDGIPPFLDRRGR